MEFFCSRRSFLFVPSRVLIPLAFVIGMSIYPQSVHHHDTQIRLSAPDAIRLYFFTIISSIRTRLFFVPQGVSTTVEPALSWHKARRVILSTVRNCIKDQMCGLQHVCGL